MAPPAMRFQQRPLSRHLRHERGPSGECLHGNDARWPPGRSCASGGEFDGFARTPIMAAIALAVRPARDREPRSRVAAA